MTRQSIIEHTISIINQLPEEKAEEISTFADFLMKRFEEHQLTVGIQEIATNSKSYDFLNEEEDLYLLSDLNEVYNGKG